MTDAGTTPLARNRASPTARVCASTTAQGPRTSTRNALRAIASGVLAVVGWLGVHLSGSSATQSSMGRCLRLLRMVGSGWT